MTLWSSFQRAERKRIPAVRYQSPVLEHSICVAAESVFEAAVEAMAAFRHSVLAEMTLAPGTRLRIRVKAPEEEHTVTVAKAMSWLEGGCRSPSELVKKKIEGAVDRSGPRLRREPTRSATIGRKPVQELGQALCKSASACVNLRRAFRQNRRRTSIPEPFGLPCGGQVARATRWKGPGQPLRSRTT